MILTISILGRLLLEEIMRHQLNPASNLLVLANRLGSALHRLGRILDHKLHVLVLLGQIHGHETVRTTHVHELASLGVDLAKVVAATFDVEQVRDLVALAASKAGHGLAHTPRARRVLAESDEHGLLVDRVEGELEAGTGERGGFGVGLECLEHVGGSREDVLAVEGNPGVQIAVLGKHAGGSCVGDHARGGLAEDALGHGEAEDAGQVNGVQ